MEVQRKYIKPAGKGDSEVAPNPAAGPRVVDGMVVGPKRAEEYILESLRMMPAIAGTGAVTHEAILKTWAKHLSEAGLVHVDVVAALADKDGNVPVDKLPKQSIKYVPPMRGPRHGFNNAARWVDIEAPITPTPVVQDPRTMTAQEREAQLSIYRELGLIPDQHPGRDTAGLV